MASRPRLWANTYRRSFITSLQSRAPAGEIVKSRSDEGRLAVLSTSAAQPLSTPQSLSPEKQGILTKPTQLKRRRVASSVPAGASLTGLGYLKGKPDPIALPDKEYPDWLWDILEPADGSGEKDNKDAEFGKSKRQRREAAKKARREAQLNTVMHEPEVPVHLQTIDLPSNKERTIDGAREARLARAAITKEMRSRRRKDIKETNYLKTMR